MLKLKTILLVEDNANDRELTLDALSEHNLANNVTAVQDGEEAMDYLLYRGTFKNRKQGNPAVILLDIKMPRMNGIEVLEAVRNDKGLKTIPIVMLSSSKEEPDLKRCYELGANAYVVKPVRFEDFFEAVRKIGAFWALLNEPPLQ